MLFDNITYIILYTHFTNTIYVFVLLTKYIYIYIYIVYYLYLLVMIIAFMPASMIHGAVYTGDVRRRLHV